MKKMMYVFLLILLSGCNVCMIGQIPPQYIYAGTGCTATVPNYLLKITASDNCTISSFTQTPYAGYVLNATTPMTSVTVKATDVKGNFTQIVFNVSILDTIKPKLTIDPSLLTYDLPMIDHLYNVADKALLVKINEFDSTFPYDSLGIPKSMYDSVYYKKRMVTWTDPSHAITGYGYRVWTWQD